MLTVHLLILRWHVQLDLRPFLCTAVLACGMCLVSTEIDWTVLFKTGQLPLNMAAQRGEPGMVRALLEANAEVAL